MKKKKDKNLIAIAIFAVLTIGDGIMGMLFPRGYMRTWKTGPSFMKKMADFFYKRQWLTRVIGIVETVFGIWAGSHIRIKHQ